MWPPVGQVTVDRGQCVLWLAWPFGPLGQSWGLSAVKNDHKSSGVLETSCGDFLNYPLVTQNHTPGSHLISKKTDHVKSQCLHIRQRWMCVLFIKSKVVVFAQ